MGVPYTKRKLPAHASEGPGVGKATSRKRRHRKRRRHAELKVPADDGATTKQAARSAADDGGSDAESEGYRARVVGSFTQRPAVRTPVRTPVSTARTDSVPVLPELGFSPLGPAQRMPVAERMRLNMEEVARVQAEAARVQQGLPALPHSPIVAARRKARSKSTTRGLRKPPLSSRSLAMRTARSSKPKPLDKAMKRRMEGALLTKYNSTSPLVTHNGFSADTATKSTRAMRHYQHLERAREIKAQNEYAKQMEAKHGSQWRLVLRNEPKPRSVKGLFRDVTKNVMRVQEVLRRFDFSGEDDEATPAQASRVTALPPVPSSMVSLQSFHRGDKFRASHAMKDPGFVKKAKSQAAVTATATVHTPEITLKSSVNSTAGFTSRAPRNTLDGYITKSGPRRRMTRIFPGEMMRAYSSFASARDLKHHKYGFGEERRFT